MQLAGAVATGQGSVAQIAQAVGVDPGVWLNGVLIKPMAGNGGKLYVGALVSTAGLANWSAGATYALGTRVINGNNVYQCMTAGIAAGSGGPTGNGTSITDNTVVWSFVGMGILTAQNGFQINPSDPPVLFPWSGQDGRTLSIISDNALAQHYCWMAS